MTSLAHIRNIVRTSVEIFATAFRDRHIAEVNDTDGTINMKINNIFIASLGSDIQYYSSLARSLDSSLGNMLEKMAISIARESYDVADHVEGPLYIEQTEAISRLLEQYKRRVRRPSTADLAELQIKNGTPVSRRHESDYYLTDRETGMRYLIELKIGGDLDNKKARSEKEALLEQYCILGNSLGSFDKIRTLFATAYNRYGEGNEWEQQRVLQFFSLDELCISRDFWNLVCNSTEGYDTVIAEYIASAPIIKEALMQIKDVYLYE